MTTMNHPLENTTLPSVPSSASPSPSPFLAMLLEQVIDLNNQGVRHIHYSGAMMPAGSGGIGYFRQALVDLNTILNKVADDHDQATFFASLTPEATPTSTTDVKVLPRVSVPIMPQDETLFIYDQAFLLDLSFLSATAPTTGTNTSTRSSHCAGNGGEEQAAQLHLMSIIILFNLALAHHSHFGQELNPANGRRACHFYDFVINLATQFLDDTTATLQHLNNGATTNGVYSHHQVALATALELAARNNQAQVLYHLPGQHAACQEGFHQLQNAILVRAATSPASTAADDVNSDSALEAVSARNASLLYLEPSQRDEMFLNMIMASSNTPSSPAA